MTREEKKNWLAKATVEELLKQYETSIRWQVISDYKYGAFATETLEHREDADLAREEVKKRLAQ